MVIFKHELKINLKNFIIWVVSMSVICGGCLLLFSSMKDAMGEIADSYANMGAFTEAFGMDKLSMATMDGFFSVEVGNMFSIGATMFAALIGIGILSKEEGMHTAEFLATLPISRGRIVIQKMLSLLTMVLGFDVICYVVFIMVIGIVGEKADIASITIYMLVQFVMHVEVALVTFFISASTKKNQFGIGLGLALILFMLDIVSRITDKVEFLKVFTPFYYSNASDIISNEGVKEPILVIVGVIIAIAAGVGAYVMYNKKDIAS
jgi:ABC-2 type transport system permease protein